MRRGALIIACGLAWIAHVAHADTRSVSYSTWIVSGDSVTLRYVLPAAEARRLTGSGVPVLTVSKLGDYVLRNTAVSDSLHDCPAIDQGYDLGRVDPLQVGAGLYGFEIIFHCPDAAGTLTLQNHALFDRLNTHVNFARIEFEGRSIQQLFTATRQRLQVPATGPVPAAGFLEYARLGVLHILRSADRLCFLLAALLLVRRVRDLPLFLGALAVGYALSLLVQATNLILPQVTRIEAFMGFLVALLAALITVRETQHRERRAVAIGWPAILVLLGLVAALGHALQPALWLFGAAFISAGLLALLTTSSPASRADTGWLSMWPSSALPALLCAGMFGFLDGFTLPAMLEPMDLAAGTQAMMVAAYNSGAVFMSAAVLALAAAAAQLLERSRFQAVPSALVSDVAAACFAAAGTFWFISRLL